jgi:hypothetical protein
LPRIGRPLGSGAASSPGEPRQYVKEPIVTRIISHIAVAAVALAAGGLGATAFSSTEPADRAIVPARPLPEQVRTVVVTKTIHRVRHVRVHHKPAPVAAPPPPVAVAPQPVVARSPAVVRRPVTIRPAPATHPLKTRTSGHGGGGGGGEHEGGEHEGGGDD